ncbi:hypothetical protein BT69DRAFT_1319466 [Atractiella rhizophila]|nr:hypothetical protein BT69DRAFT_1319466 [Atractiella rhizophila]
MDSRISGVQTNLWKNQRNEVGGLRAAPKVLGFRDADTSSQCSVNLAMEGTEAANNNCSPDVRDIHLEWKPHSPSMPSNVLQSQTAARVKLSHYLTILAATIGLVLALVATQDARRFFWFSIASLLLTTSVACVDIASRYRSSVEPSPPEAADGFVPWLLFWSVQNFIAFFHGTYDFEEYKSVLWSLPVITGAWFIAEIVIIVRQNRRGQILAV